MSKLEWRPWGLYGACAGSDDLEVYAAAPPGERAAATAVMRTRNDDFEYTTVLYSDLGEIGLDEAKAEALKLFKEWLQERLEPLGLRVVDAGEEVPS